MYGPPPDPRQHLLDAGLLADPLAWAACLLVGLLVAWRAGPGRPLLCAAGWVLALTAPWGAYWPWAVLGSFPTIDKAGSLAFYLDGVHWRLLDPGDPGVQLIGVHLGHLWAVEALDRLIAPLQPGAMAGFNLQWMLNLALTWGLTARLFRAETGGTRAGAAAAFWLAMPFGMGLHMLRDINWYTVEKTGMWWLPLYGLAVRAADRRDAGSAGAAGIIARLALPGLCMLGGFFYNAYNSLLLAAMATLWLLWRRDGRAAAIFGATALGGAPLALYQAALMRGEGAPGDPQMFLEQRAMLDVLSLWPPAWNRLELWRAVDPVAAGLAAWGLWRIGRWRPWRAAGLAGLWLLPALVALGPAHNPVYMALYHLLPGFWRVAKPEVFFEISYLMMLGIGAVQAARWAAGAGPGREAARARWLGAALIASWLLTVRLHPVWPPLAAPVTVRLQRMPGGP